MGDIVAFLVYDRERIFKMVYIFFLLEFIKKKFE